MIKRTIGNLFPRQRYAGGSTVKVHFPPHRERLNKELGGASKVYLHVRVYDRSGVNAPQIDFDCPMGSFGEEVPANALRTFAATKSNDTPTLPWTTTSMSSLPDDGTVTITPTMGLLDISMRVSGSGTCWVEVEAWYTAEYAG